MKRQPHTLPLSTTPITPCNTLHTLYTVAYWLTQQSNEAEELVRAAYQHRQGDTTLHSLLDALRYHAHKVGATTNAIEAEALDIRFTVLLADVARLKHSEIAAIVQQPLAVVRYWLLIGRQQLASEQTLRASA